MASWRGLLIGLLGVGILSAPSLGAASWRDKVSPSVLRWIDSGSPDEHVVLVSIRSGPQTQLAANSYAAASHTAWLSTTRQIVAEVGVWAAVENTFSLRRTGGTTWELGLPYVHELGVLSVRSTADGVRQLAQLASVYAIHDGGTPLPAPGPFGAGTGPAATPPATPNALFTVPSAAAEELGGWMAALGWRYVALESIVISGDAESPLRLSAPAFALAAPAYDLVGFGVSDLDRRAVEETGTSLPNALRAAAWTSASDYVLTVGDLAALVEAMRQVGADGVAIAPVTMAGQSRFLYVLLRSAAGAGWASLSVPGPGTSTTQDALPRGDAPAEIVATRGSYADRIVVQWQPLAGASSYEILRTASALGTYDPIAIVSGREFSDADVQTCIQYSYVARSIADAGLGMESTRTVGFVGGVPMPPAQIWADGALDAATIRVEWTPSEGATGYDVMRTQYMTGSTKVAAQQYMVAAVLEPSFVDTDVIVGQTYLYRVFAHNGCGQSEQSPQAKGTALYSLPSPAGTLAPPSWSEVTRGEPYGEVVVSWTAMQNADSYIILRSLAYGGPYTEVARVAGTVWRDVDVELCGDTWYRIQSVSGDAVSPPTPIMYGSYGYRPVAPEHVRASLATYSQSIRIDWAAVDDAISYQISRAPTKDGPFAVIASSVAELYYLDEGLSPGQTFWYKVRALNPCGCSGELGAVSGSTAGN